MKEATERDRGLLSLVERIMKRPSGPGHSDAARAATPAEIDGIGTEAVDPANPIVASDPPPPSLEPQLSIESTRVVSRAEMAAMILRALASSGDCPKQGFEVTVYGVRPWNALLRITPAAGPIKDAASWRARVQEMLPRLREQYELSD